MKEIATYKNQKIITIHKENCKEDFLQIKNSEWSKAAKDLSPAHFIVYIYLASNSDGYTFGLSPKAIENATGVSEATSHRAITTLKKKKYLVQNKDKKNAYDFFTTPQTASEEKKTDEVVGSVEKTELVEETKPVVKMSTTCSQNEYNLCSKRVQPVVKMSTEIDNRYIDKIEKEDSSLLEEKTKEPANAEKDINEMRYKYKTSVQAATNLIGNLTDNHERKMKEFVARNCDNKDFPLLAAFKVSEEEIKAAKKRMNFENDDHKFNYLFAIVKSNMKRAEALIKQEKDIEVFRKIRQQEKSEKYNPVEIPQTDKEDFWWKKEMYQEEESDELPF